MTERTSPQLIGLGSLREIFESHGAHIHPVDISYRRIDRIIGGPVDMICDRL
jgi:hypothetical protein